MRRYRVVVVERDGTKVEELENAKVSRVEWELNQPGFAEFTIPSKDPKALVHKVLTREVQIWRDDQILWWGVPVNDQSDGVTLSVQCHGVLWLLGHRHFGRAGGRTNLLVNGSFDEGTFNGWSTAGVTANIVDGWGGRPGAKQANVWNSSPLGSGDLFIAQNFNVTGQAYYILRAWYHIRTDMTWIGPALDSRGLYVEKRRQSDNRLIAVQFNPIDDNTERGVYKQDVLGIHAGPGEYLNVRLYTPRQASHAGSVNPPGSIIWDDVGLFVMESTAFSQATLHQIFAGIVAHAQSAAMGKSNLFIGTAGVDVSGAAWRTSRAYQHADRQNILEALEQFPEMGQLDYGVVLNPLGTTKTLTSYYPAKGTVRTAQALETGRNIVRVNRNRDGQQTKTQIIVLGEGEGASRDEAAATDTSGLGGLSLEELVNAPGETFHDALPAIAAATLARKKNLVNIPELVVNEAATPLIGVIDVGDTVPVRVDKADVQINGNFRIVKLSLDPQREELTVTVN